MATDRQNTPDESAEHGILGEESIDTTAISFPGQTAQVRVDLPADPDRREASDDVTADEIDPEQEALTGEIDEPAADEDEAGDAEDEAGDADAADECGDAAESAADPAGDDAVGEGDAADDDAHGDDARRDEDESATASAPRALPSGYDLFAAAGDDDAEADVADGRAPDVETDLDADAEPGPEGPAAQRPDDAAPAVAVREPDPVRAVSPALGAPESVARAAMDESVPQARRAGDVAGDAGRETSDVLTADRVLDTGAIRRPQPEDPWRRAVYRATHGIINLGDSRRTRERRALMARIAASMSGRARFVPVLSRKGGVGKTTITTLLGMALADARDDRVVAVDANPDRGTLAERVKSASGKTVRDLVRSGADIRGYGDMSAHVVRDATRLDVLASDTDPHLSEAFSDADYREVARIAEHFYSIVLTDTGTGIVHSVMDATLDLADQLVVVAGPSLDEARLASETLTWLENHGRAELARGAVVVLNQDRPGQALVRLDELESHFRTRVREVVRVPYDEHIATGSAIAFADLGEDTRRAARELAAHVVEGLRRGTGAAR